MTEQAKAGVFCIGLEAYWQQFGGLKELTELHYQEVCNKIPSSVKLICGGLVDNYEKAIKTNGQFQKEQVDIIFCYCATYSPSSNLLPVVRGMEIPVIVLNVQPESAMRFCEQDTIGKWLGTLSCACAPEVTAVLLKKGMKYSVITGSIKNDPTVDSEIEKWCHAASVIRKLRNCRVGLFGHAYPGMMDLYVDETRIYNELGVFTEFMELHQIKCRLDKVATEEQEYFESLITEKFELSVDKNSDEFAKLCQVCAAVWKLVQEEKLDAIAMHYAGETEGEYEEIIGPMNIVFSMLITKGIPCCVEGDIKTTIAMIIMKAISGCCATAELYGMDLDDDICLIGHSGSSDCNISAVRPHIKESEVFHGKTGKGYLTQFFVQEGPVTIMALSEDSHGNYRLIVAEGESEQGDILMLGDTNTRVRFHMPVSTFMNKWCEAGPSHHFALTLGRWTDIIKKIGVALNLEVIEITE